MGNGNGLSVSEVLQDGFNAFRANIKNISFAYILSFLVMVVGILLFVGLGIAMGLGGFKNLTDAGSLLIFIALFIIFMVVLSVIQKWFVSAVYPPIVNSMKGKQESFRDYLNKDMLVKVIKAIIARILVLLPMIVLLIIFVLAVGLPAVKDIITYYATASANSSAAPDFTAIPGIAGALGLLIVFVLIFLIYTLVTSFLFQFMEYFILVKGEGIMPSLKKSYRMVMDNLGSVFVADVVIIVFMLIISLVVGLLFAAIQLSMGGSPLSLQGSLAAPDEVAAVSPGLLAVKVIWSLVSGWVDMLIGFAIVICPILAMAVKLDIPQRPKPVVPVAPAPTRVAPVAPVRSAPARPAAAKKPAPTKKK